ncbi:ubiquitin carboxyl-terminal hydrolase 23 isoform X1 [Vicia villosa]|uniref:ubiquitin carboxyl-terminal hydrolase 23 isoform X1 n=1 Tax=Vicia villosa TaxID=3911 RepID=UPI00273ADE22|nr:ubiquitin carboxyl-terminal hydrolase 23 isoform X1 [Vicia villosa]
MAETMVAEPETQKKYDPFQRKIEFIPVKKPFQGFSNDFHIETLNPTSSEHKQIVSVNGTSQSAPKKRDRSEFSDCGLEPEFSFGITSRRIGAGLVNLGNTCFLNSVLQCLTYTEPLAAYLQSGNHQSSCRIAGFCALCAIQNHVSKALQSTGKILSPANMVVNLRCISRNFRKCRQEDAHEYMVNLLESMHKCCLPSGVPSESPGAFDKSFVHKIFGGRLRSQVKCMQCSHSSNKFDPFLDLSLEIFKADSLQKALANFTAAEFLDGGEKEYQCQRCKQKVKALKQLTINKAPNVLAIHLKRFYPHDPNLKIKKNVRFGTALDLEPYVSGSHDGGVRYSLYGVLVHSGYSTHSGHYYCYVRTSNNMWYTLDDNSVKHASEREVLNQQAYMLFYVRDRKSIAPRKPDVTAKEENVTTNVIGNRCSSTSNNTLNDYPNGQVENKFCTDASLTADTQKKSINADSSRISSEIDALVQQKHSDILVENLMNSKTPVSELTSKEHTQKTSSDEPSVAKSELTCLSSLDHSGKDNDPCIQKHVDAPAADRPNLFNENSILKACVDSPVIEPTMSNPQNFPDKHTSDKTSQSQEKNSPAEVDAVAAQDSVTKFSESNGLVTSVGTSNGSVNEEACSMLCENVVVSQELVLKDSSNISLSLNQKQAKKSKMKFPKYRGSSLQLRPIIHFIANLGLRRKNHKKTKRRLLGLKYCSKEKRNKHAILSEVGPSTSGKTHLLPSSESKQTKPSHIPVDNIKSNDAPLMENNAEVEFKKRIDQNSAVLASVTKVENISPCLVANEFKAGQAISLQDDTGGQMHNSVMRMLTRGLEETVVARWDDIELPSSQPSESKNDQNACIGYVGDEWDEDYDSGRRKKVRGLKQSFDGPNIFQEAAMEKSNKRAKLSHSSSRNPPFRI